MALRIGRANDARHAYEGSLDGISAGSDPEDEDGPRYARHENESHTGDNKREGVPCFESEFQIGNSGLLPHPPLVFGPNGEEVNPERRYEWKGGLAYVLTPGETGESFRTGYRDQVAYVASLLPGVIEEILTKSASPPIIILQSDHGPPGVPEVTLADDMSRRAEFAILSAMYLPNGGEAAVYEGMSPVNTFPVIFNHYFGTERSLLVGNRAGGKLIVRPMASPVPSGELAVQYE